MKDAPSQNGRVAVVTGANTGLGLQTALELARAGARTIIAVRDLSKGKKAADTIRAEVPGADLEVEKLDLASLDSVREAGARILEKNPRLDLLINNAGIMMPPRSETAEGFETQFGVNHLGHFVLTATLIERLMATPASRVVTVSSLAHARKDAAIHFDDINWKRSYDKTTSYAQSKLANVLFMYELQRRLEKAGSSTISDAAHPGWATTDLQRHMPSIMQPMLRLVSQSASMGALQTLRAALDPTAKGGDYFGPRGRGSTKGTPVRQETSELSHDVKLQQRLWEVSEKLTNTTFPI